MSLSLLMMSLAINLGLALAYLDHRAIIRHQRDELAGCYRRMIPWALKRKESTQ
jgi:hypothetical protein